MNPYAHLLEVQRLDTSIDRIEKRLAVLPEAESLATAEQELARRATVAEAASEALRVEERAQLKLEQDLASLSDKLERERAKLMSGSVANPKELTGLQDEVASLTRRKDELETALLDQMERTEAALEVERRAAADRDGTEEATRAARLSHDEARGALEDERDRLAAARAEEMGHLDEALIAHYEKLRAQLRGVAVGMLEDDTCGACRVELPSSELDRIAASPELQRCPECRRLLVTDRLLKG